MAAALLLALPTNGGADSVSKGSPQAGGLVNAFELPLNGAHHEFYGPVAKRGTHFATLEMAALIARVGRVVERAAPGAPLLIGDCSLESGGEVARHVSHESGRDADLLFYVRDADGHSVPSPGFMRFSGRGRCKSRGCDVVFDDLRNWWVVRTLLMSEQPAVQYIFVSGPIKRRLIDYARSRQESAEIVRRARRVMMVPKDSSAHDDHFHVRIYCSESDRRAGCRDKGRRWPWLSSESQGKLPYHRPAK